jgi:hypothetical protein
MSIDDDTPPTGTSSPGPDDRAGLEQRFEREAAEGVEVAERDTARLEQDAAVLREEAAALERQVPGPDHST